MWSPRAQADKPRYGQWVRAKLEAEPNIQWILGRAGKILLEAGKICGLALEDGRSFRCGSLVITTGTFLNGLVHVGREQRPAGRAGEPPSRDLPSRSNRLAFDGAGLKTGTPPRLSRKSIDFDDGVNRGVFHVEHGDAEPIPFSFTASQSPSNKASVTCCTRTDRVHELVRERNQRIATLQRSDHRHRPADIARRWKTK